MESLIKIPGSALYRENSTGATDVMLASDHNGNDAPELGDRVVNLCASGIPFGARGIVVGIHKASTGCVEIVMDEEFVGGTNLQGLCSNFRGKLAVWAHLMKSTVENNREITDKHVPPGSGKANVNKILSGIEKQIADDNNGSVSIPTPSNLTQRRPIIASSPNRHGSAGKIRASSSVKSRAESTGRAKKQAGWREANGPPEKGIGFKGVRKGKSGINQWKAFMKSEKKKKTTAHDAPISAPTANTAEGKSTELKAMLGVTQSPASHLKAMLGVNTTIVPSAPNIDPSQPQNPTASLKAVLGVGTGTNAASSHPQLSQAMNDGFPPPPPVPPSAADQLLQLMAKQQQQPLQRMPAVVSGGSSFNFAYTEEGKDEPETPSMMNHHSPPPLQAMPMGFPPPPAVPMMTPYGYIPHPMPLVGQHPMTMAARQPPNAQHFPVGGSDRNVTGTVSRGDSSALVSDEEFPPLGAQAPASLKEKEKKEPDIESTNTKPHEKTTQNFLVPSVVKNGKK